MRTAELAQKNPVKCAPQQKLGPLKSSPARQPRNTDLSADTMVLTRNEKLEKQCTQKRGIDPIQSGMPHPAQSQSCAVGSCVPASVATPQWTTRSRISFLNFIPATCSRLPNEHLRWHPGADQETLQAKRFGHPRATLQCCTLCQASQESSVQPARGVYAAHESRAELWSQRPSAFADRLSADCLRHPSTGLEIQKVKAHGPPNKHSLPSHLLR